MISDFLHSLQARGYAAATVEAHRRWLSHFESHCTLPMSKLKPNHLTAYHQTLTWEPGARGKMYSENSVNQAVGVVKAYFRWCVEQGQLKENPAEHLVTRRPPPLEQVVLTPAQARALLALPNIESPIGLRNRAILGLYVEQGASAGSVSRLNLTDFQSDTGALLLRERKRRIVCLGTGLQADLERYLRFGRAGVAKPGEDAFFVTQRGARMGLANALDILKLHCRRAGVPKPTLRR